MKTIFFLTITSMMGIKCAPAAELPTCTLSVTVRDEQNTPVTRVNVKVWWHGRPRSEETISMTNASGLTDTNGFFAVEEKSGSFEVICEATKEGYYSSGQTYKFAKLDDNDPNKLNPKINLVLKHEKKPIPMYAKFFIHTARVFNTAIGYDLTVGDWVAPYGKGRTTDIIIQDEFHQRSPRDSDSKITLSFPNPGDGVQIYKADQNDQGSVLRSPYEAPPSGYNKTISRQIGGGPGQPSVSEFDPDRIYFVRVRTVLDEQGKIRSALYGKLYGDLWQFRYYLNPTPNDRNIEFDPKHDLLKDLKLYEEVRDP